jgi:hypothetical protein
MAAGGVPSIIAFLLVEDLLTVVSAIGCAGGGVGIVAVTSDAAGVAAIPSGATDAARVGFRSGMGTETEGLADLACFDFLWPPLVCADLA